MNIFEFDIVIVGSGAAGGYLASELSCLISRGVKIALLESGPYYPRTSFNQRERDMTKLFWKSGAWLNEDGTMTVAAGRCVGGSTATYTGVSFRIAADVLESEWAIPGLTYDDLSKRCEKIEAELNVHELTTEYINAQNRKFRAGVEHLGWSCKPLRINTRYCQNYGFCNLGCVSGAKQGTNNVQIPAAIENGVELIANCHIDRIDDHKLLGHIVPAPHDSLPNIRPEGHGPEGECEIRAQTIILAAGTLGSSPLLMRSGFAQSLPTLGRFLSFHPALTVYGIHPEKLDGHRGYPKAYYCDDFVKSDHVLIETAFYYPFITAKNLSGWGASHMRAMKQYNHFMAAILLSHNDPDPENYLAVAKGETKIHYHITAPTIRALVAGQRAAAKIFLAAGCHSVMMPAAERFCLTPQDQDHLDDLIHERFFMLNQISIASAHPQGGCRMGQSPRDSVVNNIGQVHNHPWLYVADGSIFPGCSRVNPYLTIMALADRTSAHLLSQHGVRPPIPLPDCHHIG